MTPPHLLLLDEHDDHSRKAPPAEITVEQLRTMEAMAFHLRTMDDARAELEDGLKHRNADLCVKASRRLLALGLLYGDMAGKLEAR